MNNTVMFALAGVVVVVGFFLTRRRNDAATRRAESPVEHGSNAGHWEFYLGQVNDAPASITVDLALRDTSARPDAPVRLSVLLKMRDPADHGMGTAEDADSLRPVENRLEAQLRTRVEARMIGRIRGQGRWQIHFHVPSAEAAKSAGALVAEDLGRAPGLEWETAIALDPTWSFYDRVLAPDDERMQWILDRHVVEQLMKAGDPLTEARRVDHWVYFPTAAARTAFKKAIADRGFTVDVEHDEGADEHRFALQLHRIDSVDHDDIHAVAMEIKEAAESVGGDYDGWETMVLKGAQSVH